MVELSRFSSHQAGQENRGLPISESKSKMMLKEIGSRLTGYVAELVYAHASGACRSNPVRVQISPYPQIKNKGASKFICLRERFERRSDVESRNWRLSTASRSQRALSGSEKNR